MPYLLAAVAASVAAWLSDAAIRPAVGTGAALVVSLVLSSVVFLYAKRYLQDLRDGR